MLLLFLSSHRITEILKCEFYIMNSHSIRQYFKCEFYITIKANLKYYCGYLTHQDI